MGRSGISKEQVKEARDRLLSRGESVTVDAIRVELGNTGSKGTIHRHLKQIEDDQNKAEDGFIKTIASDLVNRLTLQIQRETQEAITQAELSYRTELDCLKRLLEDRAQRLDVAKRRIAELETIVAELEKQKTEVKNDSNKTIQNCASK